MAPLPSSTPRSYAYWTALAATPGDFALDAGVYGITVSSLTAGTAQLQKLMPDGVTYSPISGTSLLTGTYTVLQLPAGRYRMLLTGATAFQATVELIARGGFR